MKHQNHNFLREIFSFSVCANSYRNVKNIRFRYKKFAVIKFVVIFAQNMYVHKLNLKKTKFMNKMIMNRLTMLAVTLMASMACFAQGNGGKLATGLPNPGLTKGKTFYYKGVEYELTRDPEGDVALYYVKAIGFEKTLLDNFDLMDEEPLNNDLTIFHYEIPKQGQTGVPFIVESVNANAFQDVDATLAGKIKRLIIEHSEEARVNGACVELPTTGSTFAGLTGLTEVRPLAPAGKVAPISISTFDASVYKTASLIVPESEGSFLAYAKTAGWREFCKLYKNGSTTMLGDTNGDGQLTIGDAQNVLTLIAKIKAGTASYNEIYDINGNGEITISDAQDLITKYQKSK